MTINNSWKVILKTDSSDIIFELFLETENYIIEAGLIKVC